MKKVKLGIYEELTLLMGTRQIGCVFPINAHEMISTTTREIRRFEDDVIKECVPFTFSCACFIPETELVVAHTVSGSEIWVMMSADLSHPILSKFKTGQTCVYHMIYSQKSKSIITIGTSIKIFTISWELKGSHYFSSNYEVTITSRSEFADDYEASLLNPPSFDYVNERLFLPTPIGVCAFNLDGELLTVASKLPADSNTSYAFCQETQKLLTFDPTDGLCLWKTDGTIDKRINITSLIIIGLRFIDTENVICLNSTYSLHLLNIKTGNIFECFISPPFDRLTRFSFYNLHYKPYVFMCYGNKLVFLRVNAPWSVFSLNVIRPRFIQRYSKRDEAARICVLTDNSFIKLYNPKKNCLLVSITPSMPIYPSSFLYDRGLFIYFKRDTLYPKYLSNIIQIEPENPRDFLYMLYEDGNVSKFDVTKADPTELWLKKLRANIMSYIWYKNMWCFVISHIHGMLSFYSIEKFERLKEISLSKKAVRFMLYDYPLNCIVFFMKKSVKLFDLETELIKYKLKIEPPKVVSLFGDILYLGYDDGRIVRYKIVKWSLNFIEPEIMTKPHNDSVTSFDFSPNYYVSSSIDMTCVIWNYLHSKIIQLKVPFPVYTVAFHGVKRHLLIGAKDSIMLLKGDFLFGDENWDPELIGLDSYDKLDDILDPRSIAIQKLERSKIKAKEAAESQKKIEKSILSSEKKLALKKAFDEIKKNQEELIEQFKKDTEMGPTAKSPEARQRTVDQMFQLLDLAANEQSESKQNAVKNARLFMQQKETETEERKKETEKSKEAEEEEEDNKDNKDNKDASDDKKENKNSVKQKKFVSGADFIKQQIEIEKKKKKSGKKKSKKKLNEVANHVVDEAEDNNENKNDSNFLDLLNSKNQKLNKSLNKKSKVEIDITKMNFVECTTENKEEQKEIKYEYYSDDDDDDGKKKKKKKSKEKKNLSSSMKAKSLSKISSISLTKKSSQIQLNDKNLATSAIIKTDKKAKTKNKLKSNDSKSQILKNQSSHESIHSKKSKISAKSSTQSIEKLNESFQNSKLVQIQQNEVNKSEVPQLMNYEYINDDGEIIELPDGQFINDKGQIVNADGQLIDENGKIIGSDDDYRYRDLNGKICHSSEIKNKKINDFTDCIFVDDFGQVVKNHDVYLNDYGEYIDSFGEILTKISNDKIIISDDGQLMNDKGQKINAKGELISEQERNLYSDVGCQVGDDNYTRRSINSKIRKLTNFFHPQNKCYRPSTPPPIHWNQRTTEKNDRPNIDSNFQKKRLLINSNILTRVDSVSRSGRSRTPPQLRALTTIKKRDYAVPQPSCVLDSEAVLAIYGRGHTELLPVVFRLVREGAVSPSKVPIPVMTKSESDDGEKLASTKSGNMMSTPKAKYVESEVNNSDITSHASKEKITSPKSPIQNFERKSSSHSFISEDNRKNEFKNITAKSDKHDASIENDGNLIETAKKIDSDVNFPSKSQSIINDNDSNDSVSVVDAEEEVEEHHITFVLPDQSSSDSQDQIETEIKNTPAPPNRPATDHEIFRRDFTSRHSNSPQPPKPQQPSPVSNRHPDAVRRSPRHNRSNETATATGSTFQLTSSEIYDDREKSETDFTPRRSRYSSKRRPFDEVVIIKKKRKNQKSQNSLKFEILGVPVYKKDVKNRCIPPSDQIDDQWPIAINQKGRKFTIPDNLVSASEEHNEKLHNSDNSDVDEDGAFDEGRSRIEVNDEDVSKFKATRSTRTTPNSLSMARFYGPEKTADKSKSKSIIDYTYLLEPGAVEEPKVADDIIKNFEDKEDILFSLRSMFPKTNQMAMMIQTPASIKNTKYTRSLQDYSKEYMQYFRSKNIKVKKKEKK